MTQKPTLTSRYFDKIYRRKDDPWGFETSAYEQKKFAATMAALPRERYRSVFEVGCAIGVLTALLAERCDALLAVDCSQLALNRAQERCKDMQQVQFEHMHVPRQYPIGMFDLILISEVGYYWSWEDLERAQRKSIAQLERGGHLLLVHWAYPGPDNPLSGEQVHASFLKLTGELRHIMGRRDNLYWLDLFERI